MDDKLTAAKTAKLTSLENCTYCIMQLCGRENIGE